MAFRRQMYHRVGLKFRKNIGNGQTVADVDPAKVIPLMALHGSKRRKIASIGQLVHHEYFMIGVTNKMSDQRRSNKACSTRDQNLHASALQSSPKSAMLNSSSGLPSYSNGLTNSLSNGRSPSLSEIVISRSLNGHANAMSGSFQQIPLSCVGS